ncbi:hypothetical protein [Enterovirga sp.]|uniref:hypothetical protein n=1 Tax=Enterovirga sp. TaxID=2026350 RepID=UPI002C878BE7|nr:hypothetical protein [Enterovirga sp.]HMO28988.1 hypothetical protein [Enterovirga sp.]
MTRSLPAALLALLLIVVPARALEPDGLSFERAIPIVAENSVEGVPKEYEYLRRHYPGWRRTMQALLRHEGRTYDRLTIVSPARETKDIYFDITSFFGKM